MCGCSGCFQASFGCLVGIIAGGKPVVDDWKSFQESIQSYDRAIADLREAMAKSRPLQVIKSDPLPRRSDEVTQATPAVDYDALAKKYGAISSSPPTIDFSNYDGTTTVFDYNPQAKKWNVAAAPGWVRVEDSKPGAKKSTKQNALPPVPGGYTLDTTVEMPPNTVNWELPDLGLLPQGTQSPPSSALLPSWPECLASRGSCEPFSGRRAGMRQSKINLTCRSRLNLRADSFLHQRLFVRRNEFTLHVPAVYLTWANPMFLSFFALLE